MKIFDTSNITTDTIDRADMRDFSRTESALVTALGLLSASAAGAIIQGDGYPAPTPEQGQDMGRIQCRQWALFVRELRSPGTVPLSSDYIGLAQRVARESVRAVLGSVRPEAVGFQCDEASSVCDEGTLFE